MIWIWWRKSPRKNDKISHNSARNENDYFPWRSRRKREWGCVGEKLHYGAFFSPPTPSLNRSSLGNECNSSASNHHALWSSAWVNWSLPWSIWAKSVNTISRIAKKIKGLGGQRADSDGPCNSREWAWGFPSNSSFEGSLFKPASGLEAKWEKNCLLFMNSVAMTWGNNSSRGSHSSKNTLPRCQCPLILALRVARFFVADWTSRSWKAKKTRTRKMECGNFWSKTK